LSAGYCPDHDYHGNALDIMDRHHLRELDDIIMAGAEAPYQLALMEQGPPSPKIR
jgi:hypothetical protein